MKDFGNLPDDRPAVQQDRIIQAQKTRKATDEIPILEAKLAALKRAVPAMGTAKVTASVVK